MFDIHPILNIIFFLGFASISLLFCIACIVESDWSGIQDFSVFFIGLAFAGLSFKYLIEEIQDFKAEQRRKKLKQNKDKQ